MARITRMTKRRLGELLQAEGLVTEDQIRAGLEEQRKSNLFLGEALVKLGFVSEEAIAHTIVQQFSLPFLSANQYNITPDVLNLFPERMYYEYQFISVDKIAKVLIIVGAGLMNHDVLDELERLSGCRVCQFVSTWKDIRAALDKHAKDLKKEQSSLSSLGSMLLDNTPMPAPAGPIKLPEAPTAPPKPAVAVAPPKPTAMPGVPPPAMAPAASKMPPAPVSPRPSALAGVRPPSKTATIPANVTPPPANPQVPQSPMKSNTGLLGLFKKPQ